MDSGLSETKCVHAWLFFSIMKPNPDEHPLIHLMGIQADELQAFIGFMYDGEVNVVNLI